MGMDAAHRIVEHKVANAERVLAEHNPAALASEREANALLTDENERLTAELERWQEAVRWHAAWPSTDVRWTHSGGANFELPVAESIALRASLSGAG